MKVSGPGIISQSLPYLENFFDGCLSQVKNGRKPFKEAMKVLQTLVYACLLQNNLRYPYLIR
jgi:hypothetical protein